MSHGEQSPADLAAAAYEAIRALNHATLPGRSDLIDQHDVNTVLADVSALLHITRKRWGRSPDGSPGNSCPGG